MASIVRPAMVSHPSSQSSPPPSPVDTASPSSPTAHHGDLPQPLDINTVISKTPTRPRLPGRQETPPSPPNSVVLGDQSPISPAVQNSPSPAVPVNRRVEHEQHEDQTPPASLKQRITRVFKAGHKRGESDLSRSTNTTEDTIKDNTGYLLSPLKENDAMYPNNPNFYTRQMADPIRPVVPNNRFSNSGTKRRIMNGGEVRVEILPHPSLMADNSRNYGNMREVESRKEHNSGAHYYKYYTRSSRDADEEFDDEEDETTERSPSLLLPKMRPEIDMDHYLPPLNHQVPTNSPRRSQTLTTQASAESQERRYVEESVSFGFEGFHIGNGSDVTYAGLSSPASTAFTGANYSSSGMASSAALNHLNQSELNILSRNASIKTNAASGKSSGGISRPGMSRNPSSASYFSPGMRSVSSGLGASSGSVQLDEAVSRELKRLSKISAGSGASGFAMVITADGAASTRVEEESSDDEMDRIAERKYTKEEKGKGRAVSSVASENVAERKGSDARDGRQDKGHQYTTSDASKLICGDRSQSSSDNGDNDESRLLKGVGGGSGRRKLKSQEVQKGVLVHQGDTNYDFVYRMRETDDATPILVPQYFYPSDGAFPNRNALTSPIRAKIAPLAPIRTRAISFSGRYGSSPITRPEEAKRSPDSSKSFHLQVMGGDQALDSPDRSPHFADYISDGSGSHRGSMTHSMSENKMQSLVHPALRNPERQSARGERQRPAVSMGSLEGLAGFGLGRLVTGTPNGTGRRIAGSSLADDSDLSMGDRPQDSSDKSPKRAQMGGVDDITFVPPLQRNPTEPHYSAKAKASIPRSSSRLPMRPKILRRSMTPRLYDPRPLGESWKDLPNYDAEAMRNDAHSREYRMKEKRAGRITLAFCLLFPPLLLLAAMGTFDATVDAWTEGEVKGVGRPEKRIAAVVGGVFAIGVVAGGVAAAVLVAS